MSRFWLSSLLVWLVSQEWMFANAASCDYFTAFIFPLATDSCMISTNATGSYSSKAECTGDSSDSNIKATSWDGDSCNGDVTHTEIWNSTNNPLGATWVCDADKSGADCDRTLYRVYSEDGCDDNQYYSEFYIVNNQCVAWNATDTGSSVKYTCDNDVMWAHVYQSDDCSGDTVAKANFTSGCTDDNQRIKISCGAIANCGPMSLLAFIISSIFFAIFVSA